MQPLLRQDDGKFPAGGWRLRSHGRPLPDEIRSLDGSLDLDDEDIEKRYITRAKTLDTSSSAGTREMKKL